MMLSLGFSPCPNDTFMFEALITKKINAGSIELNPCIKDIEELNKLALNHELDITKLSFSTFARVADTYALLDSGSALGTGNGPLLIGKKQTDTGQLKNMAIAIPGLNTTANLLLSIMFPEVKQKKVYLFSEIEQAVINGETDAGLIIHESRFTYESKGLKKIIDLGEYWEKTIKLPLPLGGIAIKRSLPDEVKHKMNEYIRESVVYAFEHPLDGMNYIKQHATETDDEVIKKHINLYVNEYSVNMGEVGRKAVNELFGKAVSNNIVSKPGKELFLK